MQIEVGKKYRTRNGEGWRLAVAKNPITGEWIVVDSVGRLLRRMSDGSCNEYRESHDDLIEEWKEPRTWTVQVVTLEYPHGAIMHLTTDLSNEPSKEKHFASYPSKIHPDSFGCKVLARRTITLTEGEGVTDGK